MFGSSTVMGTYTQILGGGQYAVVGWVSPISAEAYVEPVIAPDGYDEKFSILNIHCTVNLFPHQPDSACNSGC
jgi:hypothetical protein